MPAFDLFVFLKKSNFRPHPSLHLYVQAPPDCDIDYNIV